MTFTNGFKDNTKTYYSLDSLRKSSYLSSIRVNDETNQFNEILYHLLEIMLFIDSYLKYKNEPFLFITNGKIMNIKNSI